MLRGSQSISDLSVMPDPSQNNLRGGGVSGKGNNFSNRHQALLMIIICVGSLLYWCSGYIIW